MHSDRALEDGINPFKDDKDVMFMSNFAVDNKCDVELYVEPKASTLYVHGFMSKAKVVDDYD